MTVAQGGLPAGAASGTAAAIRTGPRTGRPRPVALVRRALDELKARRRILASGLFDAAWYRARYRDVASSGIDPAIHYLRHGAAEGRDPGPRFDTAAYLRRHPDAAVGGANPLLHFLEHRSPGEAPPSGDPPAGEA